MKKVTRINPNTQVTETAVLISPGYGAGWYSWHMVEDLLFHPILVELVEQERHDEITHELIAPLLGISLEFAESICIGGAETLVVRWVPQGVEFRINEYDGNETLVLKEDIDFIVA